MQLSIDELKALQIDRDALVSQIATLQAKPEHGSLNALADRVCYHMQSLTPDQKSQLRELILHNGGTNIGQ